LIYILKKNAGLFYFISFLNPKKVNFERGDIERVKLNCIKIQIL